MGGVKECKSGLCILVHLRIAGVGSIGPVGMGMGDNVPD